MSFQDSLFFSKTNFQLAITLKSEPLKAALKKSVCGLRKLKNFTGEIFILPNGTISQVVNYSMKNSLAIVDVTIPFELGVEKIEKSINLFLESMGRDNPELLGKPKLIGAHDFTEDSVIERIIVETRPMRHFDIARNISMGVKRHLEQEGIEIPYPTLVSKSFN